MATRVRSYSKINLGLAVGPARADGFHALATVYQTLALHDLVTVTARRAATSRVTVTTDHPGVPCTARGDADRNTAWRMVMAALARLGICAEVELRIDKRLPVQGGMGAGSANAAAALLGLERELAKLGMAAALPDPDRLALDPEERLALAAEIGSDVPLFLLGGTVLGLGRGEEVYPLPDSPPMPCVVAVPKLGVSTALAFAELDKRHTALTFQQADDRLSKLSRVLAAVWTTDGAESGPSGITRPQQAEERAQGIQGDLAENPRLPSNLLDGSLNPLLALVRTGIENDFEEVVFSQNPSLRSTKRELMGTPGGSGSALYAALSGSGAALFGLYGSRADAIAAQQRVQKSGTRAILTETLPRRGYGHTMFAESFAGQ
jgi:4-diphosphocytidyl-2-C-methyl-D-erythritol kinase